MTTIALSKTFGERARSFLRRVFENEALKQARAAAARAKIHQASGMLASITDGRLGTQPDSPCADKYKTFVARNASINRAEIYNGAHHHHGAVATAFGMVGLAGTAITAYAVKLACFAPQGTGISTVFALAAAGCTVLCARRVLKEHNASEAAKLREGIVHGNIRILDERAKAEAAATPIKDATPAL